MPTNESEQTSPFKQGIVKDVKELQDLVYASNYGLPRDFIENNEKIVHDANKAVNDVLLGFGVNNLTNATNSLQELSSLVSQSIRFKRNKVSSVNKNETFNETDPKTGFKTITPLGNIDADEREIIDESAQLYQSFLNVTSEYRGVVKIIPEIDRAIKNIVRDILSVSELSGRILSEVYDDDDTVGGATEDSKKSTEICNKLIQEEIIDKNKLETKLKRWVYESVVCGVKPVAFIPYDYIIRQLTHLNEGEDGLGLDIGKFNESIKSGESCCICSSESEMNRFYEKSVESSFEDMIDPSFDGNRELKSEEYFDKILDDELCERYIKFCDDDTKRVMESLPGAIDKAKDDDIRFYTIHGTHSVEANEQLELLEAMSKTYGEKKAEISKLSSDDKLKTARKGLKQLARLIDDHIDVVKTGASSAFIANKIMNQKDKYSKFYNLGENYLMAEGFKKKQKNSENNATKSGNNIEFDSESALGKDCLIVPYSPESVVPVNINGEYMGFYAMEYEHATGPQWKHRKRSGSFTDYVLQQGYGNDANFLGGNAPMVAYGGSDPLENNLYSPLALYNYSINQYMSGGGMDQQDQRFDIMKTVVLRVIAHRLRDPNLADNKVFKDAVMHMLRNDILVRRKIQFTFIPPEYMCYMTYQTDDDGIPKSILDGTLFFAYMYIASVVSSAMIKMLKSSDKEKYEVDVGLQKNAGYTIDELQRVLSTRTVYTSSMFSNLSSVLKNAGSYQRMIIPVFNDKKLYDVSQIEHVNDLNPDDDFTGKLLNSILSKIYVNAGMSSEMDSVDFAKQLSMRNLEYRNNIIEAQNNYEPFIKMQLRLLVNYSNLDCYNSKSENYDKDNISTENKSAAIDISRINPKLQIPTMLSMTNIVEMLDSAKNVANGIAEVMNLQDGSEIETARNNIFKKKIIEKYANIVEWSEIENMLTEASREAPKVVNEHKKLAKIDEAIQNPDEDDTSSTDTGSSDLV